MKRMEGWGHACSSARIQSLRWREVKRTICNTSKNKKSIRNAITAILNRQNAKALQIWVISPFQAQAITWTFKWNSPELWEPLLFLMTNPCDLPIKRYAPASLYTAVSSGHPLLLRSLLQAHYLARISESDHAICGSEACGLRGVSEACPVGLQPHHEQAGILTSGAWSGSSHTS